MYEAENTINRKRIALKVLPKAATGGTFVERFKIESRVMMDLRHAHIVQVHHAGEEGGLYYLTMDLVTGRGGEPESLEDLCSSAGLARRSLGAGGSVGGRNGWEISGGRAPELQASAGATASLQNSRTAWKPSLQSVLQCEQDKAVCRLISLRAFR